jgi:hypothetical protein
MGPENLTFTGTLKLWFSTPLGEDMELYLSAGVMGKYEGKEYSIAPELYRTEFTWRPAAGNALHLGRLYYADPLGFIAEGLFDGAAWESPLWNGRISAGAYYTGLLYKESAYIVMDKDELGSYNTPLDYGDFMGSYFAPRRALIALGYSSRIKEQLRMNLALLGQIDLNGRASYYTSEYLIAKFSFPYRNLFVFEAGASAELIQTSGESLLAGFAGELKISWMPPSSLEDRLSLEARYASGRWADTPVAEFRPLTTETQGQVLRASISGLSAAGLEYTARFHRTLGLDLSASYFIQNDLSTYDGIFSSTENYFLGAEAYAQLIWSPLSDMRFCLGGGAFLPMLGNTKPAAKPLWLVNLNIIIAFL